MERPLKRKRSCQKTKAQSNTGQGSVEYAVIFAGVLSLVVALGTINSFLGDGTMVTHALQSASHAIENVCTGSLKDIMSV